MACLLTITLYNDQDIAELLHKVEHGDFPPPRKLKGWIDPAAGGYLPEGDGEQVPAQRYPTPRALADDVEHWLADEPVSAWREPIRRRLRPGATAIASLVTGMAATLIDSPMAALAVGNLLVDRQRDRAPNSLAFARTVDLERDVHRGGGQTRRPESDGRLPAGDPREGAHVLRAVRPAAEP